MAMTLIRDTYRILDVATDGDSVRICPDDSQAFERAHLRAPLPANYAICRRSLHRTATAPTSGWW
ncbi:hypothetical protein [Rhodococcus aetherivorans]|uniref:hypothetical protein n=1 Tax=Rhodococcus aetherivorans TaxID=191292 RepID=UPI00388EC0AF